MSVGAFVNDWIDEVFNLEYDEVRWRRVEKGMVVGGVVLAVASALVIYMNWRFIWRAVLFWGCLFGETESELCWERVDIWWEQRRLDS